jgi:molybdenum cofactor synthesis domain-containing protein
MPHDSHHDSHVDGLPALVVTVSDSTAAGTREDGSGPVVEQRLSGLGFEVQRELVADEPDDIARIVASAADAGARLIVTTGGTGLGPRDRTPEGVTTVVDYVVPGFGEAMRAEGRTHTPLAALSRSFGAVRGQTLILCVPGSPKGASESLDAVDAILAHTLDTLSGRTAHS